MAISDLLKTTSFFWEKELLYQNIKKLPKTYHEFSQHFGELSLKEKQHYINHGMPQIFLELTNFPKFRQQLPTHLIKKLKAKKAHELGRIASFMPRDKKYSLVDLCGGVGHLPRVLSCYNPKLVASTFDHNPLLIQKGKELNAENPLLDFQLYDLKSHVPSPVSHSDYVIGLHTCGDLSDHAIDYFLKSSAPYFLNWGCCYHKRHSWKPLSKLGKKVLPFFNDQALTLAAKSYKPLSLQEVKYRYRVKSYRYSLEFLLQQLLGEKPKKLKTTSLAPHYYQGSFYEYWEKIQSHLPPFYHFNITKKQIHEFFTSQKEPILKRIHLGFKRDHWGRMIEAAIIIDRALYLEERGHSVEIIDFFNREISPRNLGIYAVKLNKS